MTLSLMKLLNIYHLQLFPWTKNASSSWSWKPFHLLYWAICHYCWFSLLLDIACIPHVVQQLTSGYHWILSTLLQPQLCSIFSITTFPQKSRIQLLLLILNLRQFVFLSFLWWLLYSLSSVKTNLTFLNFTVCLSRSSSCWCIPPEILDICFCV